MQQLEKLITEESFESRSGSLDFSCVRIELVLTPGALYEGAFTVYESGSRGAYGTIISTDARMECLTERFNGSEETISYRFHGDRMEEGDEVKGEFHFISNVGEYTLPYVVRAQAPVLTSSRGEIRNLNHFVELAKNDWAEAVKLFYMPEFTGIFRGSERKYADIYRGLSAKPGNQRNVEEFLIACGKKQPISYLIKEEELAGENPAGVMELSVTVLKDGWGYTGLRVSSEGEFLYTEKEFITEDDFLGNQCTLPVYIDSSMLHRGRNFGRITLSDPVNNKELPVKILSGTVQSALKSARLERDRILVELIDCYQCYRLKKIGKTAWVNQAGGLVERLIAMDDQDIVARLFQAYVLIMEERYHEASWVLTHSVELMERRKETDPALKAFYLYLTTLINRDREYLRSTAAGIEELYKRNRYSWRVAWFLLLLSPQYAQNNGARWEFLERQFHYGCTSPIWYLEALLTLNGNPALLRRLGEYEIQVLNYGARKELINGDLMEQLLYLAGRSRAASPVLLRLLIQCYQRREDQRLLFEICSQLIRGGRTDEASFAWYELGVEKELRITRLYEYYMMSMDLEKEHEISKKALMYFSWQTDLDYEHTAYLYSFLYRHREQYGELLEQYRERMELFVVDQILKEHINRHLAYLYQELLVPAMFSRQLAEALSRLLFAHMITVENPNIVRVLVYRPDMEEACVYPVVNKGAWAALYDERDTVFLEDEEGNRYAAGIPYTMERLMKPEPFDRIMAMFALPGQTDPGFDRYLWEKGRKEKELSQDTVERGRQLLQVRGLSGFVKGRIRMRLLRHYRDKDDIRGLDDYLEQISCEELDAASRGEVMRSLVLRDKLGKAYDWLDRFGPYGVDPGTLVRLCEGLIEKNGCVEDQVLTEAAAYAFLKDRYGAEMLGYLVKYYRGTIQELEKLRKAALSFEVDAYELCQRLLMQMMFTGVETDSKIQIFRYYLTQGAKPEVAEAFLSRCANAYLIRDCEQDSFIFREICNMHKRGERVRSIEKLAYLKYCAQQAQDFAGDGSVMRDFLREMMNQGIRLEFFKKLPDCEELLKPLADKVIVECRTYPDTKVTIHYALQQENGEVGPYRRAEMNMAPGGIFFREFVLFFGESLQYYFTMERDRQTSVSGRKLLKRGAACDTDTGRYHMINGILQSISTDDFEAADRQLEELYHKEYLSGRLFTLR